MLILRVRGLIANDEDKEDRQHNRDRDIDRVGVTINLHGDGREGEHPSESEIICHRDFDRGGCLSDDAFGYWRFVERKVCLVR